MKGRMDMAWLLVIIFLALGLAIVLFLFFACKSQSSIRFI